MKKNNIDDYVLQYRESDDAKERNTLFKKIARFYQPSVYLLMGTFDKHLHDEIQQTYYMFVLQCIERWRNEGALFSTYLYPYAHIKLKSEILEKYVLKQRREPNFTDMGLWDEEDL